MGKKDWFKTEGVFFRTAFFTLLCFLPWAGVRPLEANELQRLVFNASGNLGVAALIIETQGFTPENSATLNGYINTAVTMLDQLAGQYFDPPFDSGQIRRIVEKLQRFARATERLNNRGRASYLEQCHSDLKLAMSVIFRSD